MAVNIPLHIGEGLLHGIPERGHFGEQGLGLLATGLLTTLQALLITSLTSLFKSLGLFSFGISGRNDPQCRWLPGRGASQLRHSHHSPDPT